MNNFEKAIKLNFDKWNEHFDKKFNEAISCGEISLTTSEELKYEAHRIWCLSRTTKKGK